jgi:hypothetical protein
MHRACAMGSRKHIDRAKHEVDVAEHVLGGGVRTADVGSRARIHVVVAPWQLGIVASVVQVEVLDDDDELIRPSDRRPGAGDRTLSPRPRRGRPRSH